MDLDELVRLGIDVERVRDLVAAFDASRGVAATARMRALRKPRGRDLDRDQFARAFAVALARSAAGE